MEGLRTNNYEMRNKRDVWSVCTAANHIEHYATYPPELIRPCILAGSAEGDTVLDPFFGVGTTGLVAAQEGRYYVGIELNPESVRLAKERIRHEGHRQMRMGGEVV